MKLQFTPSGRILFLEALSNIHQDNPQATVKLQSKAERTLRRLTQSPESGRPIPELPDLPFREILVAPYRFFYRREGNTIWVVGCWRGAQLPTEQVE